MRFCHVSSVLRYRKFHESAARVSGRTGLGRGPGFERLPKTRVRTREKIDV